MHSPSLDKVQFDIYMEPYKRPLKRVDCNTWWRIFLILLSTHVTFEMSTIKIRFQHSEQNVDGMD